MTDDDRGAPIAYTVLEEGTPVQTRDGVHLGTVKTVLSDEEDHIFDGIVVDTDEGERFVDAPQVDSLYERVAIVAVDSGDPEDLPEAEPNPGYIEVTADDLVEDTPGDHMRDAARRAWDRLSGNY